MRTTIQLLCIILLSLFTENQAFSQESSASAGLLKAPDYEEQIRMVYGNDWMAINTGAVAELELCLSTRITYLQEELTLNDKYPLLSSFPLMNKNNPSITAINYADFDPESFIALTYNLPFFSDLKQVIRVDGTNYIIVIDPIKRN